MVRDTGTSIPAHEQAPIFERFHRVQERRGRTQEGAGIGLALVRELVQLHRGTIRVESEEGAGSRFIVTLPLGRKHLPKERVYAGEAKPPQVSLRWEQRGSEAVFAVADNGMGIDPQYHQRIFEIFRRLHSHAQIPGTGIGLAICQRIVERHGGRIWLESEASRGSVFYFSLPTGA